MQIYVRLGRVIVARILHICFYLHIILYGIIIMAIMMGVVSNVNVYFMLIPIIR